MPFDFFLLFIAYGWTFGIQNKLPFLHEKHPLLDKLLDCPYCLGFHGGWLTWLTIFLYSGCPTLTWMEVVGSLIAYTLGSASFCYLVDTHMVWAESNTFEEEESEEE